MELEHMRRALATKAMGWERIDHLEDGFICYQEDGRTQAYTSVPSRGHSTWEWQPDRKWQQCGLVIEAMREKGWALTVTYSPSLGIWVKYHKTDEKNRYRWATSGLAQGDFCAEVCEVAARALEAVDE